MPRRPKLHLITAISVAVGLGLLLAAPALSGASLVDDLVGSIQKSSGGGSSDPTPQAGSPSNPPYVPPMHGTNPHGQGTVGVVDITPSSTNPLSGDPAGGDPMAGGEDVVLGRSRGEQQADGSYHGHITVAALFGNELVGVDTTPGQTATAPTNGINSMILDPLCDSTMSEICIQALSVSSSTTDNGSTNHFQAASVALGTADPMFMGGFTASGVSSNGNISDDGNCQTSHGDSSATDANLGGGSVTADALSSSSDSQACNDGSSSQTNTSHAVAVNGNPVVPTCTDSPPGGVNQAAIPANPILDAVCAADDSNGAQAAAPYGVREALTVFVLDLPMGVGPLLKIDPSAESRAVAPGTPPSCATDPSLCPPKENCTTNPSLARCNDNRRATGGREQCDDDDPETLARCNAASSAVAGKGNLAFTGTNVLLIAMLGCGLLGAGLALKAGLETRHRAHRA
jgi:hypothetical protein